MTQTSDSRPAAGQRRPAKRSTARVKDTTPAADRPVAKVAVDIPLAHLDRPFDYLVPERMAAEVVPGCRVRVRFSGKLVDGFVLDRMAGSDHPGRLSYLDRVVSAEPVLSPEIAGLARAVADRYAGTLADVLRLAVPARHAGTEAKPSPPPAGPPEPPAPGSWARYPAGEAFLSGIADGRGVRAAWSALPGPEWPDEIAVAAATAAAAGRGTVIVVPDVKDLARVDAALTTRLGPDQHVCLTADLGPSERYRRWLAVLRGSVRISAGTRAAMFAPVRDLGLVVLWDDGDDLHAERRAPYPHAREVLALRGHRQGAAALIGGFSRTTEATQLVASGWARTLAGDRGVLRATAPRVRTAADEDELERDGAALSARLPSLTLRTARAALAHGPVLVQVPRRGYLAAIACGRCRAQARCTVCSGQLEIAAARQIPHCRWCGAVAANWSCPRCGFTHVRAMVTGAARTAEELGRAFPSVPVRFSGGQSVIATVPADPAVVVATPGAEPVAAEGYAGALLLDGWALLGRPSLRAAEEALRKWLNAAALARPGSTVLINADAGLPAVQALIRWDPVGHAERELAEREELAFPPAVRMAAITGPAAAVGELLGRVGLPAGAEVLGPVPDEHVLAAEDGSLDEIEKGSDGEQAPVRALIRVPRAGGSALARALQAAQAARSPRKDAGVARVQLDPAELI
ncbi:MAG TPA: primosomal protein N' [Streptosporangiaceae bacterium]|nr:primosomal protein N' [Streptosporangiaceae bacterium]